MDSAMIPWAVAAVFAICGMALTSWTLRHTNTVEADKRYIASLEQIRKDDHRTIGELKEEISHLKDEIRLAKDEQIAMHKENKSDHDSDLRVLREDHSKLIDRHHEDLMEVRAALRGCEGAVNAAVQSVERWRP